MLVSGVRIYDGGIEWQVYFVGLSPYCMLKWNQESPFCVRYIFLFSFRHFDCHAFVTSGVRSLTFPLKKSTTRLSVKNFAGLSTWQQLTSSSDLHQNDDSVVVGDCQSDVCFLSRARVILMAFDLDDIAPLKRLSIAFATPTVP